MSAEHDTEEREGRGKEESSEETILRELVNKKNSLLASTTVIAADIITCFSLHRSLPQCAVSGCNYERLLENGRDEKITKIEIFFFGFPRMSGLHHFPNLTSLCIINQPIRSLDGLESCDQLTELWVCETALEVCDRNRKIC